MRSIKDILHLNKPHTSHPTDVDKASRVSEDSGSHHHQHHAPAVREPHGAAGDAIRRSHNSLEAAEAGNNFPGTNPHPAHSALGRTSGKHWKGLVFSGWE